MSFTLSVRSWSLLSLLSLSFLSVMSLSTSVPNTALACSCAFPSGGGFMGPKVGRLPANSVGVAWYTFRSEEISSITRRLTVEVKEGDTYRRLKTQVTPVKGMSRMYVVGPHDEALKVGHTYRFTVDKLDLMLKRSGKLRRQVVVTIDAQPLAANTLLTLNLKPVQYTSLSIPSRGGRCSRHIAAAAVEISAQLPPQAEPWASQLLYQTQLDENSAWRGRSSICQVYPEGRSWTAVVGTDKVYRGCERFIKPGRKLGSETKTISMRAILPGTDIVLQTIQVIVDLTCPRAERQLLK